MEIPAPLGNGLGIMVSLEHGISLRLQQTLAHREPRRRCLEGKSGLSYSSRRKLPFQEGKPEGDRRCRPEGGMWEGGRRGSGGMSPHPSERSRWCRAGVITRRGGGQVSRQSPAARLAAAFRGFSRNRSYLAGNDVNSSLPADRLPRATGSISASSPTSLPAADAIILLPPPLPLDPPQV